MRQANSEHFRRTNERSAGDDFKSRRNGGANSGAPGPLPKSTHYTILNIPASASEKDIKIAYRKLALQYHPDKNGSDIEKTEMFKQVSEAYSCLSDKVLRREYDETIHEYRRFK